MARIYHNTRLLLFVSLPLIYFILIFQAERREQKFQENLLGLKGNLLANAVAQTRNSLLEYVKEKSIPELLSTPAEFQPAAFTGFDTSGRIVQQKGPQELFSNISRRLKQIIWQNRVVTEIVAGNGRAFWQVGKLDARDGKKYAFVFYLPFWESLKSQLNGIPENSNLSLWLHDGIEISGFEGPHSSIPVLPKNFVKSVKDREQIWVGRIREGRQNWLTTAIPLKDFEMWDVIGILTLSQPAVAKWQQLWQMTLLPSSLFGFFTLLLVMIFSSYCLQKSFHLSETLPRHIRRAWLWLFLIMFSLWALLALRDNMNLLKAFQNQLAQLARPGVDSAIGRAALSQSRFALSVAGNIFLAWFFSLWLLSAIIGVISLYMGQNLHRQTKIRRVLAGYSFIAPSALHLLIFSLGPILFAFFISFHAWSILSPERPFVGMANYHEVITNRDFWNSLKNTAIYTLHVPFGMAISLILALLMNRSKLPGLGFLRTVFYLPSITSFVAIAIVWQWIYNPDFGLLNYGLSFFHLGPYPWLNNPGTALLSLMLMAIWIQAGYQMIIYLAGLQNIPAYLYEAAIVDGANSWQRFWHITFPMLKPTTFFILVTSVIGSFQVFTQVYVMTEGGPLKATEVIVYYIYKNAWDYLRMGYASALSFILFIIIMALTLIQFRLMGRREAWV